MYVLIINMLKYKYAPNQYVSLLATWIQSVMTNELFIFVYMNVEKHLSLNLPSVFCL